MCACLAVPIFSSPAPASMRWASSRGQSLQRTFASKLAVWRGTGPTVYSCRQEKNMGISFDREVRIAGFCPLAFKNGLRLGQMNGPLVQTFWNQPAPHTSAAQRRGEHMSKLIPRATIPRALQDAARNALEPGSVAIDGICPAPADHRPHRWTDLSNSGWKCTRKVVSPHASQHRPHHDRG
jgi:hypothetical protein